MTGEAVSRWRRCNLSMLQLHCACSLASSVVSSLNAVRSVPVAAFVCPVGSTHCARMHALPPAACPRIRPVSLRWFISAHRIHLRSRHAADGRAFTITRWMAAAVIYSLVTLQSMSLRLRLLLLLLAGW